MTITTEASPTSAAIPSPGFADPTRDAQSAFRALLDALAHPTRDYPLAGPAEPPAGLGRGLAAVALTVLDEDSTVWLGALAEDQEVVAWLDFHTGSRRVADVAEADFAFATPATAPTLSALRLGTDEAPHLSTTLVLDVRPGVAGAQITEGAADDAPRFVAEGPGINGRAELIAPWVAAWRAGRDRVAAQDADGSEFLAEWRANGALFPRGADVLIVGEDSVSALPRTTRLAASGSQEPAARASGSQEPAARASASNEKEA
ncbi:MAG: phosphonate C-P lyase system protein PhnH [Humibacter sp.]